MTNAASPRNLLRLALLLGAGGALWSYRVAGPARFWANWLVWTLFLLTVGLGAMFVVALERLVGARWSVPVRRAPERLASLVPVAAPLLVAALAALPVLYPWVRPAAEVSPVVAAKAPWLNVPFFVVRVAACVGLWGLFYVLLVRRSFRQDRSRDPALSVRMRKLAPLFMVVFAFSITVVAFDWISSLEPEWYSDMFGVYLFAGTFLAGLAASTLAVVHLLQRGRLPGVRSDHLYNLGGLMFAFTVFWSYIAFAQYMLIWYGNLPEEVTWFKRRVEGAYLPAALLLALLHFVVPFFVLVARRAKSHPGVLRFAAIVILSAHLLDLYWNIMPVLGERLALGVPELSFAVLFVAGGLLWVRQAMTRGADMPVGDPLLPEALELRL